MGKIVLKSNLQKIAAVSGKPEMYVTRAVRYSTIDGETFLDFVARNTRLDRYIVKAAAGAIAKEFANFVFNGHSVSVPGIGIFRFGVQAKASAIQDEATAKKVYRRKILYRPTTDIKTLVKNTSLEDQTVETEKP